MALVVFDLKAAHGGFFAAANFDAGSFSGDESGDLGSLENVAAILSSIDNVVVEASVVVAVVVVFAVVVRVVLNVVVAEVVLAVVTGVEIIVTSVRGARERDVLLVSAARSSWYKHLFLFLRNSWQKAVDRLTKSCQINIKFQYISLNMN